MKKRSKIIVGVLVLFLVMAVGYAIFAQTLKINGTASANGKLDLTYECFNKEEYSGTGTCTIEEDKSITTTSTFSKPDDSIIYVIKVTNTGSIPAVLKTAKSPNNVGEDFATPGDEAYLDKTTLLSAYYGVGKEIDSNRNLTGEVLTGDQVITNAGLTIQPGESIYVGIAHIWFSSNEQPELPEEGASISYNLTFDFQQVTE